VDTIDGVRVTYLLVVHLPVDGVHSFQRYEAAVLPLLTELYELTDD
jgi:hypothetical protein